MKYKLEHNKQTNIVTLIITDPPKWPPKNRGSRGVIPISRAKEMWPNNARIALWNDIIMIPDKWEDEIRLEAVTPSFGKLILKVPAMRTIMKKNLMDWMRDKP